MLLNESTSVRRHASNNLIKWLGKLPCSVLYCLELGGYGGSTAVQGLFSGFPFNTGLLFNTGLIMQLVAAIRGVSTTKHTRVPVHLLFRPFPLLNSGSLPGYSQHYLF